MTRTGAWVLLAAWSVAGDEMYFQAIARTGATIDKGVIRRREVLGAGPTKSTSVVVPATPK